MIPLSLEAEEDMANINNDRCSMGRNVRCDNMLVKSQRRLVVVDSL